MSTPENKGSDRSWLLKDWQNLRQAPFDLDRTEFGIDWSSDQSSGTIEFRLSGRVGGPPQSFGLDRGKYRGILDVDGHGYQFTFTIDDTTPRVMTGRFFDMKKSGGPDPVATWGAEERGGPQNSAARS
jgi:hypothetical protein